MTLKIETLKKWTTEHSPGRRTVYSLTKSNTHYILKTTSVSDWQGECSEWRKNYSGKTIQELLKSPVEPLYYFDETGKSIDVPCSLGKTGILNEIIKELHSEGLLPEFKGCTLIEGQEEVTWASSFFFLVVLSDVEWGKKFKLWDGEKVKSEVKIFKHKDGYAFEYKSMSYYMDCKNSFYCGNDSNLIGLIPLLIPFVGKESHVIEWIKEDHA